MMKNRLILFAILGLLAAAAVIASCMGTDPEEMSLHDLLREGRRSLEAGDAGPAYNFFLEARRIAPEHPQALWGTVLSNDLLVWRNLTGIIDLLTGVYVKEPQREECERACARIDQCDFLDEFHTDRYNCVASCPWKLQPFMFEEILAAPTCNDIMYGAAEWIIQTSPEDCRRLCESLDRCGNIDTEWTYDLSMCIERCPLMYVVKHSSCYLANGEFGCHRFDRTCFEHTVLGIQIIVREIGAKRVGETMDFAQLLLDRPDGYQYYLKDYVWDLREPPFEINLPGRFSRPELYLSRGLLQFWNTFVYWVAAQNLDINTVTFDQFTWSGSICQIVLRDFLVSIENTLYDPIFPKAGTLKIDDTSEDIYAKALGDMAEAGYSLGRMFGEFAKMIGALLEDTDNQQGRSLHYDDVNQNFRWDDNETWTLWDLGVTFTKQDAIDFLYLFRALERNFLYEEPVSLDLFKPILKAVDIEWATLVIELIKLTGREAVNPSYYFLHTTPEGIRPPLIDLVELLNEIKENADDLPAFLECTDLD